ncbi:esterase-like activity of phytase family protein [Luteococcus sanguinis]|uniref:Esterase-like activity of phytase family protein n=2 Tax=Luteococcus sanguinis TaxID=174038 RepID=A0ABW1WYC0_9ACTN
MPKSSRRAAAALTSIALAGGLLTCAPDALANNGRGQAPDHGSFTRTATFPAYFNTQASEASVAEISTITPDGKTVVYTDAAGQRIGFVDVRNANSPKPLGTVDVPGEPTSVYATGSHILVCVDQTDGDFANPKGALLVFDASTRELERTIDLGGQPDSIDVTADGAWATIAIENQRDEEFAPAGGKAGDLPQLPAGFLTTVHLDGAPANWTLSRTELTNLPGMVAPSDPEPEYVKISPDGRYAALTLQENNQIAIIDFRNNTVVRSFSAGTNTVAGIDVKKDGVIDTTGSITDVRREPDSIGWVDDNHVATANEGDWKGGTRGWTVFNAASGAVVWDAGNTLEQLVIANGSWPEDRAAKKGIEPEGLAVATFGGTRYAFVGSERANVVAVYDVTDPANPVYKQMLPSTNGPEGILPVPSRNMLVVSSETDDASVNVRASVQLYTFNPGATKSTKKKLSGNWPQLTSDAGIAWGALGALTADPTVAGKLWSATDSAYKNTRILEIDATQAPAQVVAEIPVTKAGKQASYDVEGLWRKADGSGFWLGVEGATGAGNLLVETDAAGVVLREVTLPAGYTAKLGKQGIEGVTGNADGSVLYVAMQREASGEDVTRIGRYDVATGEWTFYGYQLETTDVAGDWIGLSEITYVGAKDGADQLAVIERDKLNGPNAQVKRLYTFTVAGPGGGDGQELPVVAKELAYDVLPVLQSTNGWTQEKLEGMTIDANRDVYVITDNDGVKDATGETVFANLGKVFGR